LSVNTISRSVPVFIVGGGPVGLALATELGTRGVECLLVERTDGSVPVPKATQLSTRTMEYCRRWGIADEVRSVGWPRELPGDFIYLTSMTGYELARQRYAPAGEGRRPPHTPEGPLHCPQIFFDPVLLKHARTLPSITLRHRTELESFSQDVEAVYARVRDLESGKTEMIAAQYFVGCDSFD